MKIFRQDKIELNRGDWKLIIGYLVGMSVWLAYRFYAEGYGLTEGAVDILVNVYKVTASFFATTFS